MLLRFILYFNVVFLPFAGNMHGMPVSLHLKEIFQSHYDKDHEQFDWFKPRYLMTILRERWTGHF